MTRAVLLGALALVACKAREQDVPTRTGTAPGHKPAGPGRSAADDPQTADALIQQAQAHARDHLMSRITLDYIAADGTLDPRYSKGSVGFTEGRVEDDDDPDRPTGAPVRPRTPKPRPKCPTWSWEPGTWGVAQGTCSTLQIETVKCPVLVIWQRAIDDGAPRDALAKLTMIGVSWRSTSKPRWSFEIRDTARGVSFSRSYADDCGPIAEAPDPTVAPDRPLPEGIDRKMITNSIGTARPKIRACHTGRTRARVTLRVLVSSEGAATATVTEATTPDLGACVAAVVGAIEFPRTRGGGSFSYPFTF